MLISTADLITIQVLSKTISGVNQLIEAERQGEGVDRQLLAHLLRMTSALGLYEDSFQAGFLERTQLFYRAESQRMIQEGEVAAYLEHCEVGCCCLDVSSVRSCPST